ncbi:MAG TPA: redoxin domain-containing protein [Chitinophagaceae bacterium]
MKKVRSIIILAFSSIAILPVQTQAQTSANAVTVDSAENVNKLIKTIESNPDDLAAHEAYLKASGFTKWGVPENKEFIRQYEEWMKKFPKSATVAYSLGHAFAGKESPKAKPYLLKAVELDPKFDKAYFDLWIDAERWGDSKAGTDYLMKAKNANPKSADYAFYYANSFSDHDYEKYKTLSLQVAKDFPETERGAQALYWLGNRTKDPQQKVVFYELQKKEFPPEKFNWSSSGMSEYFNLLLMQDPEKAVKLAEYMAEVKSKDARAAKTWEGNVSTAKNMIAAEALLKEGKAADAMAFVDKLVVPRYSSAKEYMLLFKSKAYDAAGKSDEAYKNLLTAFVREPSQKIYSALKSYGKKAGKDENGVDKDIWYSRDTMSKQAPNFTLENYYTKKMSSLSDYKGKVVLLTYWFPGCGPCRGEFPHFENVVRKFKGKDVVYLGINIVDEQDEYVLPFMKSTGYSFIPLRDTKEWTKGPLDNRNAAPVNFLIDGDGKIIFSNFRTDGNNEATLEMMIESMLTRKKS